jgi:hypothetical protein
MGARRVSERDRSLRGTHRDPLRVWLNFRPIWRTSESVLYLPQLRDAIKHFWGNAMDAESLLIDVDYAIRQLRECANLERALSVAPARAATQQPENAFETLAVIGTGPASLGRRWMLGQMRGDAFPLFIGEYSFGVAHDRLLYQSARCYRAKTLPAEIMSNGF